MKIKLYAGMAVTLCGLLLAGDFQFQRLGIEKGLSQSSVLSIVQDRDGFLWVATWEGLNRYDGYKFEQYHSGPEDSHGRDGDYVNRVLADSRGNIWAGFGMQNIRFRPYNSHKFQLKNIIGQSDIRMGLNMLASINEDENGNIWLTDKSFLVKVDRNWKSRVYKFKPDRLHSGSMKTRQGKLWYIFLNAMAYLDENADSIVYINAPQDFFRKYPKGVGFNCGAEDSFGNIWLGTNGAGVFRFTPATGKFTRYLFSKADHTGLSGNEIWDIYEDSQKRLWIATSSGLNLIYNENNDCRIGETRILKFFHDAADPGSLSSNQVTKVFEDNSGVLWIGTQIGLNKLNPNYKKFISHSKLAKGQKMSGQPICFHEESNGGLWMGSSEGLGHFTADRFLDKIYTPQNSGLSSQRIWSLQHDSKNRFWVGTPNGLNRYDAVTGKFIPVQFRAANIKSNSRNRIYSILEDKEGMLWCSTDNGLVSYDPSAGTSALRTNWQILNRIGGFVIMSMAMDSKGNLWCGTDGYNVARYDKLKDTFTFYETDERNPQYIGNTKVMSILIENDSTLWLATLGGGLKCLKWNGQNIIRKSISTEQGLANSYCYCVIKDKNGYLWTSTNQGISKLDPKSNSITNYSTSDGLPANECIQNAAYRGPSGKIYIGTVKGFVEFFPDEIKQNPFIPPIVITGFKIFDEKNDEMLHQPLIELQYSQNFFSFEFAALCFNSPENNHYAYMLEGFDDRWRYPGSRRYASYTNLNPGEYVFHVIGTNNDGVWNKSGARVKIIIIPPFYLRWWFKLMMSMFILILLAGGIVYILRRKYHRRINELEKEKAVLTERQLIRDKIARDLHDDLASTVSSAGLFIETAKMQIEKNSGLAVEYMNKTSSLIGEAEETIGEIVWAVSPKYDRLQSLCARLRQYVAEICRANQIEFAADINIGQEDFPLNEAVRRGLYLIVKESVNNIIKHAAAGKVNLSIVLRGADLSIFLADDGRGFGLGQNKSGKGGNGLGNMQKRADEIMAVLNIDSAPGTGTKIHIQTKLTQLGY